MTSTGTSSYRSFAPRSSQYLLRRILRSSHMRPRRREAARGGVSPSVLGLSYRRGVPHRVAVSIDGHTPVSLTSEEASDLAEALWYVGEYQNGRGGIALSVALLDAKNGGPLVDVETSQLPALREAISRLAHGDETALASLARAVT